MAKTPEEIEAIVAKQKELEEALEKSNKEKEHLQIENEAQAGLLRGLEKGVGLRKPNGPTRDQLGGLNLGTAINEETGVVSRDAFDKEVEKISTEIISKYSDEQLQDATTFRKILHEYGSALGKAAYNRALGDSIGVFHKAVNVKSVVDGVIDAWRKKNPEFANPRDEKLIENFLWTVVTPDPVNKNKPLIVLIDLATEEYRKFLDERKLEPGTKIGDREEIIPLTMSPSKAKGGVAGSGKGNKEEKPMTNEESAERFLEMRRKMSEKKAWTGRPSA